MPVTPLHQRAPRHRHTHPIQRHPRHTHRDRIIIPRIQHIHNISTHRSTRSHHRIFLRKLTLHPLSLTIQHLDETIQSKLPRLRAHHLIHPMLIPHRPSPNINRRPTRRIHRRHNNLRRESSPLHHSLTIRNHISIQLVHTNILHVHILDQIMQHLPLSIPHIILQLRQHRHRRRHRHTLKHTLLPILTLHRSPLTHLRTQVRLYQPTLSPIVHKLRHSPPIQRDCIIQLTPTPRPRRKHHLRRSLQILLIPNIMNIRILPVTQTHNLPLQLVQQPIQRVAHLPHPQRPVAPNPHLSRVSPILRLQLIINTLIDQRRILRRQVQLIRHQSKPIQHIAAHIQRKHSHKHDIHQIDHLLTRRHLFLLELSHLT